MPKSVQYGTREQRVAFRRGGCTVDHFLGKMRADEYHARRKDPVEGVSVRRVANLAAIPQGRAGWAEHCGSLTTVTTLPIDYKKARRSR